MAYREYIGSRYVPIFGRKGEESVDWDNEAPYEPLTIVLHEGNSFTSRQYVPKGIDINNEEYWLETGNFNAQVEAYRREVLAFDERITGNSEAIAAFNEELGQYEETTNQRVDYAELVSNVVIAKSSESKVNSLPSGHAVGGVALLDGYLYLVTNYKIDDVENAGHEFIKMDLEGNIISTRDISSIVDYKYHVNQLSTFGTLIAVPTSNTVIKLIEPGTLAVVNTLHTFQNGRGFSFFTTPGKEEGDPIQRYAMFMTDNPISPYEIWFLDETHHIFVRTDLPIERNVLFPGTYEQNVHVDWPLAIELQSFREPKKADEPQKKGETYLDMVNIRCGGRRCGSVYIPEIEEEVEGITTDGTSLYLITSKASFYKIDKASLYVNGMYDFYKKSSMPNYNIAGCGLRKGSGSVDYVTAFEYNDGDNLTVVTPLNWTQQVEKVSTLLIYGAGADSRPNLLGRAEFGGAWPNAHAGWFNQATHLPAIPIYVTADQHVANAAVKITAKEGSGNTEITTVQQLKDFINSKWGTNYQTFCIFLTMDESFKFSAIGIE